MTQGSLGGKILCMHRNIAKIVDGKALAQEIFDELKIEYRKLNKKAQLAVFWAGSDKSIESFIKIKKHFADFLDIDFKLSQYGATDELDKMYSDMKKTDADAVVLQLPLPKNASYSGFTDALDIKKDVDLLKPESFEKYKRLSFLELDEAIIPPVAFAVSKILQKHDVSLKNKKIVVLGRGILVGLPVYEFFKKYPCIFSVLSFDENSDKNEMLKAIKEADIIVSGTGQVSLVKKDDIRKGVILIDAGTASQKSKSGLAGDIDYECEEKASLFARTPGGVGPLTVAGLYSNMLKMLKSKT